jgi:acyl-coenzyme A thioesterase PaaI-like protein
MSSIYPQFLKLNRLPGGKFLFSKAIEFAAPLFGKIKPKVIDLRPGYCEVKMKDRWGVRNHLGTVNAGALCSLTELTGVWLWIH